LTDRTSKPGPGGTDDPAVPDGDEKKGRPKDDRATSEAVLEAGLPPDQQRKPRTGSDAADEADD